VAVASTATISTAAKETVSSRSTNSRPPSFHFIALTICGMRMALRTPADSRLKMTLGRVLAASKVSSASEVPSIAVVSRELRTRPRIRDTMVPAAITALARLSDADSRARAAGSSAGLGSTAGDCGDDAGWGDDAVPARLGACGSCWLRRGVWEGASPVPASDPV
jgi:hypothetical protein